MYNNAYSSERQLNIARLAAELVEEREAENKQIETMRGQGAAVCVDEYSLTPRLPVMSNLFNRNHR